MFKNSETIFFLLEKNLFARVVSILWRMMISFVVSLPQDEDTEMSFCLDVDGTNVCYLKRSKLVLSIDCPCLVSPYSVEVP